MLKKRLERLEDAATQWIKSLPTAELETLAGPISPAEHAFLASLSTEQLEHLDAGAVSFGEYHELRRAWELKNALTP